MKEREGEETWGRVGEDSMKKRKEAERKRNWREEETGCEDEMEFRGGEKRRRLPFQSTTIVSP